MKKLLLAALLLAAPAAMAQVGQVATPGTTVHFASSGYQGPGDAVTGASMFWGTRGYNAAYSTGSFAALTVRSAAGAGTSTQVLNILSSGTLDIPTALSFGADASGTGSITATALTFTGGHIGDTVTGVGVATGTYILSGTSPNWTVNNSQSVGSETLTLTYGLYVTQMNDQTGNGNTISQGTAADQPQLVFNGAATRAYVYWNSGSNGELDSNSMATGVQPLTITLVGERDTNFTNRMAAIAVNNTNLQVGWLNSANTTHIYAGSYVSATTSDSVMHSMQYVVNGASSAIVTDSTATTGLNPGTAGISTNYFTFAGQPVPMNGYLTEMGIWPSAFNSTVQSTMHTNMSVYWGTAP